MEKELKIKEVVNYNGHSVKNNGVVDISFKAKYSELVNTIQLMQLLNNDIVIKCKLVDVKPFRLGVFRIKSISVDNDGESTLKFSSITDSIEMENVVDLVTTNDFQIQMESIIEVEE